jgi:hypothetical protein
MGCPTADPLTLETPDPQAPVIEVTFTVLERWAFLTLGLGQRNRRRGLGRREFPPTFLSPFPCSWRSGLAKPRRDAHEMTAETLARLILWGLDQAMAGRPRPLRLRCGGAHYHSNQNVR